MQHTSLVQEHNVSVDMYGFFCHHTAAAVGDEEQALCRREHETRWWEQSMQAYRVLQLSVAAAGEGTMDGAQSAQRQLVRGWWCRLYRGGGLCSPALRACVWSFLSGDGQRTAEERAVDKQAYERRAASLASLLAARQVEQDAPPSRPPVLEAILRDLARTFPGHCLFAAAAVPTRGMDEAEEQRGGSSGDSSSVAVNTTEEGRAVVPLTTGQEQLLRLLWVYSTVDSEVGYCQGMAFVAGVLLLQAPEADAFLLLRHIMQGTKLQVRRLYCPGFPLLATLLKATQRHVTLLLPRLHAHFQREEVQLGAFASQWFLTFFSTQLPMPVLCRLWDAFLLAGWRVWVAVAVGLLRKEEPELLVRDMEEMLLHLQRRASFRFEAVGLSPKAARTPAATAAGADEEMVRWFLGVPVDHVVV